jgi:DNA-binding transcriptional LysR family regulator
LGHLGRRDLRQELKRPIRISLVRRMLTDFEPPNLAISAVRPGARFLASKVWVFIDFLAEVFAEEPSLTPQA